MNTRIERFDPNILKDIHTSVIVVIGKNGSGKSTMIEDIISFLKIPIAIVMAGTEDFYSKHIHPLYIYDEYRPDKIKAIISSQTKKLNEFKKKYPDKIFTDFREYDILIVIDNLDYDTIMKDPSIKQLFFNSRCLNIIFIISLQENLHIPPSFRSNIDFLFIGDMTEKYMNKLCKQFEIFSKATTNYEYLVLDTTTNNVFSYHVTEEREYKIGSDEQWISLNSKMKYV